MTRTLNLDGMFIPVPYPEIEHSISKFPGGEIQIKLNERINYSIVDKVIISHRIRNSDDLILVLLAKDALKRKGVKEFDLIIPYVPYARQDQVHDSGESLAIKVFADIINSSKFNNVYIVDPHSPVTTALIDNVNVISSEQYLIEILKEFKKKPILISPDAGAHKKLNKLAINHNLDLVKCDKFRDVKTGQLSGFHVFANDLHQEDCIIFDDICDGGGTFIGLAKELKKKNAGKIYLYITHGIFSKGLDIFDDLFEKIYTTNSFKDVEHYKIKQYKIYIH
jgi:ribose-phosphate pyrophosphokinase